MKGVIQGTNGPMKFGDCLLSQVSFLVKSRENARGKITLGINILTDFSTLSLQNKQGSGLFSQPAALLSPLRGQIHSVGLTCFSAVQVKG